MTVKLKLLPKKYYFHKEEYDPIRFYYWPIIGSFYKKRVELCLDQCARGEKVLDVGFGSGVNFLNLDEMYKEVFGIDLTADVRVVQEIFDKLNIRTDLRNGNVLDMPFPDNYFDTVLLVSILEHLKPEELIPAILEIKRVLKPGGRMVYGVPVESRFMTIIFRALGYNIREHHFSTEQDVLKAAEYVMKKKDLVEMKSFIPFFKPVYNVGHFIK